jgi:hypothetical protein
MKAMIIAALFLILLGMALLSYQWMNYTAAPEIFRSAQVE